MTVMNFRRILMQFLMLLMLTPSMACFMTMCPEPAQAAQVQPPCHEVGSEKYSPLSVPMLVKDCLQNDLGQVSDFDIPLPVFIYLVAGFLLSVTLVMAGNFRLAHARGTDPPPRTRISFHRLLVTQRIRQ